MDSYFGIYNLPVKEGRVDTRYASSYCEQIQNAYSENPTTMVACAKIKDGKIVGIDIECSRTKKLVKHGSAEGYYGEKIFSFGDVKRIWKIVKKELESGEIPAVWMKDLEEAGLITENDEAKDMAEQKNNEEIQNLEEQNTIENVEDNSKMKISAMYTGMDTKDIIEELTKARLKNINDPEKVKVVKKEDELDMDTEVEAMMQEQVEEEPEEDTLKETEKLPVINPSDSKVVLTRFGKYQLNMIVCVDISTMQSEKCRLYISDTETRIPYLSMGNEISISREKIANASDHKCMNIINKFNVNFTEDNRKEAYQRAKEYLECCSNSASLPASENILSVYARLMEYCRKEAELERVNNEITENNRIYNFDKKEGTIAIRDSKFQKVLDDVGSNYTKVVFCKKLRLAEIDLGKDIIISNCSGGKGYGFNATGNIRYYKFRIHKELLKMLEKWEAEGGK